MKIKAMNCHAKVILAVISTIPILASCSKNKFPESEIYTLYASAYPFANRDGLATFDLANIPELNGDICQETADALDTSLKANNKAKGRNDQMRYWCEKGRYRR